MMTMTMTIVSCTHSSTHSHKQQQKTHIINRCSQLRCGTRSLALSLSLYETNKQHNVNVKTTPNQTNRNTPQHTTIGKRRQGKPAKDVSHL
jgi:hypothetical protein